MSGLPSVVTHIGGLCNIVIPGLNGYVADLTPESLADAILSAVAERPLDDPVIYAACRKSFGKDRWDEQVWSLMTRCLELHDA